MDHTCISGIEPSWEHIRITECGICLFICLSVRVFYGVFYFMIFPLHAGGVTNQSIPIVLSCCKEDKERLDGCSAFALKYEGKRVAIFRDPEFFPHNKEERCCRQFGTSNKGHPYVKVCFWLFWKEFKFVYWECESVRCKGYSADISHIVVDEECLITFSMF